MYDVTTIGTLTMDLYFKSECLTQKDNHFDLALGGKYFTDHFYENLGGGATNVAIGMHKHGLRVSLMTLIGKNSFKPLILEKLHDAGISYFHSKMVDDHLNISCILLAESGEKTVINYQSPHQHLMTEPKDYEFLLRTKAVYLANVPDVSFFDKLKILKFLHKNEKKVFANFGVIDCRRTKEQIFQLLEYVDVVIVNGHEFADMVKTNYERISFKKNIMPFYFPDFQSKTIIITDGERGSYGYSNGKTYFQEAVKPAKILDSTGAGDGFSAGFIGTYIKTNNIEKSMLSGAEYASKILAKIGAN